LAVDLLSEQIMVEVVARNGPMQPPAAMAHRDYCQTTKVSSASELVLYPFLALNAWDARRATQVALSSMENKDDTFSGKRRRNQDLHILKEITVSLTETYRVSKVVFSYRLRRSPG
jgi:hypothetical protein